jgi:hypothetical protein
MLDRRTQCLAAALAIWLGPLSAMGQSGGDATLGELIRTHPECRQFNDGCSICRVENGKAICSVPGIACIRTAWTCVSTGAEAPPEGAQALVKVACSGSAGAAVRRAVQRP